MKLEDLVSIDQLMDFLSGTQEVAFSILSDKDACYQWIQATLVRFSYLTLPRQDKGIVIRYLMKISDNQAADQLLKARQILFKTINEQNLKTG